MVSEFPFGFGKFLGYLTFCAFDMFGEFELCVLWHVPPHNICSVGWCVYLECVKLKQGLRTCSKFIVDAANSNPKYTFTLNGEEYDPHKEGVDDSSDDEEEEDVEDDHKSDSDSSSSDSVLLVNLTAVSCRSVFT